MSTDYKSAKEAFVSGMTGSSINHVNHISLVALASVSLYAAIRTRLPPSRSINFVAQWTILVLPLLLSMTLFANQPMLLSVALLVPAGILLLFPRREHGTPLPSSQPSSPTIPSTPIPRLQAKIPPLPALTTYRAHMMLMTVLAILAVDFRVFPRSLAKCESFGVSLMDLGVGSFVFSQGVVSAIPLIKDPTYLTAPLVPKLAKVTRKSLPVILLGLVRVLLVKGTEYPEHESEYGRHWNFFITLALIPVLQVLLHPILIRLPISVVGALIACGQQAALSQLGLQSYVLTVPRTSLISANKEGIISLTGYLSIHLLGLSAGTIVLPPSPSFFRRLQQSLARNPKRRNSDPPAPRYVDSSAGGLELGAPRQLGKTVIEMCSYALVWWSFLGLSRVFKIGGKWGAEGGVSRQMVNLPYILWVAAFNTSFLLAYLLVLDLCFFPGPSINKPKVTKALKKGQSLEPPSSPYFSFSPHPQATVPSESQGNPPPLLEAINKHGLPLFLIANVLTGVINLTVQTMYASDIWAMCVLSAYAMTVSSVAWAWSAWEKEKRGR
ncbi:GWT1-domain-containing protein [Crucibulum laeve]|uniref:GPI-anchored wall transfer protein n=1 Tax=Crucibulum laeve TaxID=68775 RepID=A0A5C3MC34_9AGAR|nr:GWT1-domain-containing protein [Crucibulum laeve]